MSIALGLPAIPINSTIAPPAGPEHYQYYRGGNFQRKGLPNDDNDGLYAHDDPEHVHAVTGYRGNTYGYDANGNMISRTVDGTSYILTYDAENRLISVAGGGPTVTFTYDGDDNRVKKDEDGIVTLYPGRHYEATKDSGSTKYFPSTPLRTGFANGQLVSFERSADYGVDNGRRFVFRDHPSVSLRTCLGSTSVIVNGRGEKLWEDRYLPFGDVRYTYRKEQEPGLDIVLQTQFRYTSQWFEDGLGATSPVNVDGQEVDRGLYFYGARWYDSSLGRFIQPDTIVPEPGNPQSLNRYSYSANSPVKYTDPSGHAECEDVDCTRVVHPVSGKLVRRQAPRFDSNSIPEVVQFVYEIMMSETTRDRVELLRILNDYGAGRPISLLIFATHVRQGGPWDPKPQIVQKYEDEAAEAYYAEIQEGKAY